ncbi:MAG TPA: SPOR domain-containing protein [Bacteroidales bacterium]|nr:SPOR domain-containing protein [Bacteroidales bacterium]
MRIAGITFFILLLLQWPSFGQSQSNGNLSDDKALEFGGFGGFSQYYGDISDKNYFQKFSGETKPSFGFFGRYHFNDKHAIGLGFNRISHYSRKDKYANGNSLNNEFSGHSNSFFLHSFLNMSNLFWGPAERKLNLYGTLGIGFSSWQSTRRNTLNNSIIIDYTTAANNNLNSEAFYFPASLGVQFRITPALSLFAEGMFTTLISDDLDYYRDGYQYDMLVQTHIGLSYKLPLNAPARTPRTQRPETSSPRRSGPVTPIYVIDYEKFAEMPGERQQQLPTLEPPKQTTTVVPQAQPVSRDFEFRVQIYAASRRINNPQSLFRNVQFESPIVENVFNGLYRYSTGSFASYSEAEAYAKRLQSRGIHDAFVVAYRNNERISITSQMKSR